MEQELNLKITTNILCIDEQTEILNIYTRVHILNNNRQRVFYLYGKHQADLDVFFKPKVTNEELIAALNYISKYKL